jgi:O-acetylserine/cysteine efflux transporter
MLIIGAEMFSGGTLLSFFIILAAAMFWGVLNIIMKKAGSVEQYRLMVWASLIPPLPLIGLSFVFEEGQQAALMDMTLIGVLIILYTGVLGTVVAFAIWGKLIQKYSPTVVSPFSLLVPIYGTSLSAIFLGEQFDLLKIVGSVTVFAGLGLIVSGERIVNAFKLKTKYKTA